MKSNTKERILEVSVQLFAKRGYEATSMSDIAKQLDITKPALYKHYTSKQEIFDCILERMSQMDCEQAKEYEMPEGLVEEMAEKYRNTTCERLKVYTLAQFKHWTEDEFSSAFRKMLTLEQYRDERMAALYQQYLAAGPVGYLQDLFQEMSGQTEAAKQLAIDFYAPVFLAYSLYDGAKDRKEIMKTLSEHIESFLHDLQCRCN